MDEKFKKHYLTVVKEVEFLKQLKPVVFELQQLFNLFRAERKAWEEKIEREIEIIKLAYPEAIGLQEAMHDGLKKKVRDMTSGPEDNHSLKTDEQIIPPAGEAPLQREEERPVQKDVLQAGDEKN